MIAFATVAWKSCKAQFPNDDGDHSRRIYGMGTLAFHIDCDADMFITTLLAFTLKTGDDGEI